MPELPDYMFQKGRQPDPIFSPDEFLYRRVPKDTWGDQDMWSDEDIDSDCIEFPDMSVTRQKYGLTANSARWERGKYVDWGVLGFQVQDIPESIPFQGAFVYKMRPAHKPEKRNYPHSEVQVFEAPWDNPGQETHIGGTAMPGITLEAKQEWRELLRRRCRIALRPGEEVDQAG
jgi:hypothetical protein